MSRRDRQSAGWFITQRGLPHRTAKSNNHGKVEKGIVMDHKLAQKTEGTGNMAAVIPTCSCGWIGSPEYAYNDDQCFQIRKQGERHLREAANTTVGQPAPILAGDRFVHQSTD